MRYGGGARWAMLMGLALAIGCDGPEPADDAGADAGGGPPDAGPADAGPPDAGGGDCEGPPGLYVEGSCDVIAPGVRAYQPRYALWSDGAQKERYIYLPPGTQIDTSDPDNWVFPVGTRIYKTFLHDGVRLETRVLEKHDLGIGPNAWYMRAYAWNEAQDRVTEVQDADDSVRQDVLGTQHDIPSQSECRDCHSGVLDVSNSFSAIQLNHDLGGLTLATLLAEGLLSDPIELEAARIPGDATAQAALGYLHANCGNCHRLHPDGCIRPGPATRHTRACESGFHMWIDVGVPDAESTSTFITGVGQRNALFFSMEHPCRIQAGAPEASSALFRAASRDSGTQMPPIGTEIPPPMADLEALTAWIGSMPAAGCP